jgi:hypothetical protein
MSRTEKTWANTCPQRPPSGPKQTQFVSDMGCHAGDTLNSNDEPKIKNRLDSKGKTWRERKASQFSLQIVRKGWMATWPAYIWLLIPSERIELDFTLTVHFPIHLVSPHIIKCVSTEVNKIL